MAEQARGGKFGIAFDLEGSMMLENDLAMLGLFRDLGVRQVHLAYNRDNSIAGGCHGADRGLTRLGCQVAGEINEVCMLMDCSHTGLRSSLALHGHPHNITDDQIDACART